MSVLGDILGFTLAFLATWLLPYYVEATSGFGRPTAKDFKRARRKHPFALHVMTRIPLYRLIGGLMMAVGISAIVRCPYAIGVAGVCIALIGFVASIATVAWRGLLPD